MNIHDQTRLTLGDRKALSKRDQIIHLFAYEEKKIKILKKNG